MPYTHEWTTAIEAVRRAARLCVAVRATLGNDAVRAKSDASPVTVADYGAQALVCALLAEVFPDDQVVGEEDAAALREPSQVPYRAAVVAHVRAILPDAPDVDDERVCGWIDRGGGHVGRRFWTLDPIDGTKGFVRDDQYAVALALVEDGQVKLGALACPALPLTLGSAARGALFVATRGQGAWMGALDGGELSRIGVGARGDAGQRLVESVEAAHGNQALQLAIARELGIAAPPLRMDSQAKYGAVARGDATLYLRLPSAPDSPYREQIWDHAAGSILVEEAGGRVTDVSGAPLDFAGGRRMLHNRGVVVSDGSQHDAIIALLAAHGA